VGREGKGKEREMGGDGNGGITFAPSLNPGFAIVHIERKTQR